MKNRRGYILLETLMAILILSVGVIMLSRALLSPVRAVMSCRQTVKAYRLIDQKFDELRLGTSDLKSTQGETTDDGKLYTWRVSIGHEADNTRQVVIEVKWNEGDAEKHLAKSAFVCDFGDQTEDVLNEAY